MNQVNLRRWVKTLLLTLSGTTMLGACNSLLAEEFRSVAATGLQEGVTSIATSVIDGAFAIFTPNS